MTNQAYLKNVFFQEKRKPLGILYSAFVYYTEDEKQRIESVLNKAAKLDKEKIARFLNNKFGKLSGTNEKGNIKDELPCTGFDHNGNIYLKL